MTRATVSGLMAALARDGLVKSQVDGEDRRKLIARLTAKGEAVIKKQHELNLVKFRAVLTSFTSEDLSSLTALLHRFRKAFAVSTILFLSRLYLAAILRRETTSNLNRTIPLEKNQTAAQDRHPDRTLALSLVPPPAKAQHQDKACLDPTH